MAESTTPKAIEKSKHVIVACKMPQGIVIRDYVEKTEHENVFGGEKATRKVKVFRAVGPKIRIKGPNVPSMFVRQIQVEGGYAFTHNVPADVFARWLEHNKDAGFVRNKLILADPDFDNLKAMCRENEKRTTGMEPLDVSLVTKDGKTTFRDARAAPLGDKGLAVTTLNSEAA